MNDERGIKRRIMINERRYLMYEPHDRIVR